MQPQPEYMRIMPDDLPAGQVVNMNGSSGVVLICEHASAFIPPSLNALGLDAEASRSHAAWDIGALDVARAMSVALDAPLISATVSRLVYDCNRPPGAPSAMPETSERYDVPGNHTLTPQKRAARIAEVYEPFQAMVADVIAQQNVPPVIVTVHTFTPTYYGDSRKTEIGLLHDRDADLAQRMIMPAASHTGLTVDLNAPYAMTDGVTHTLATHGIANGLPNVMIEIRNDLVSDRASATQVGTALALALRDTRAAHPSNPADLPLGKGN